MKKRKWLSILLVLTMLFTCIPAGMFAEDQADAIVETTETVEAPVPAADPEPAADKAAPEKEDTAPAAPAADTSANAKEEPTSVTEPEPAADEPAAEESEAAADPEKVDDTAAEKEQTATTDPEDASEGPVSDEPAAEELLPLGHRLRGHTLPVPGALRKRHERAGLPPAYGEGVSGLAV